MLNRGFYFDFHNRWWVAKFTYVYSILKYADEIQHYNVYFSLATTPCPLLIDTKVLLNCELYFEFHNRWLVAKFPFVYSILKYIDEIQHYWIYFSDWQLSLKCQNTWRKEKIHQKIRAFWVSILFLLPFFYICRLKG